MPPRFFCANLEAAPLLDDEELHHLRTVRRLAVGDAVELFDGRGRLAQCTLVALDKRRAEFAVVSLAESAPPCPRLTIATAIPKGPRMDTLVEKTTELGVAAVWPVAGDRSAVAECGQEKQRGWRRRAVEACKQSGLLWLPEFAVPAGVDETLARLKAEPFDLVLLADPSPEASPILDVLSAHPAATILAFIGPEGGFTAAERAAITAAGAIPVRLSPTILRIETAAIAVTTAVALSANM